MSLTKYQVLTLAEEAATAGDLAMVEMCRGWLFKRTHEAEITAALLDAAAQNDDAPLLYECDNGRILCANHLGSSAQHTGRDISGLPIREIEPDEHAPWVAEFGEPMQCETCRAMARRVSR